MSSQRDTIARAIYEEPGSTATPWTLLSNQRKEHWRCDADRVLAVLGKLPVFGFASFKDGSFELIVRDDASGDETTLCGVLKPGQLEMVGRVGLATCVYVPVRPASVQS